MPALELFLARDCVVHAGELLEAQFLIELEFLHGRDKLATTPVMTFLKF